MRGLSLIGLLAGLGIVGVLIFNQLRPSPQAGETLPTEAIERAEEAADTVEENAGTADALQKIEQIEQDLAEPDDE
ncbi:MAG: hypothetical protein AAF609_07345 [Cyanobacteria bacterium P01_C01_bin.120]